MQQPMMEEPIKPSIKVALSEGFADMEVLKEVLSGIEEESVPYDVIKLSCDEAVELSYNSALDSVLDVGVGLDAKGNLAVHYAKLPSNAPLFTLNYRTQRQHLRSICSNGARLTKGIPFIIV